MTNKNKLIIVKTLHTAIWVFFNVVILYMLYEALTGKIDCWLWLGFGLVATEGIVLLVFKFFCPLTIIARKYSDSEKDNFDIYLPNWLARHNKIIYSSIVLIIIIITIYRLTK